MAKTNLSKRIQAVKPSATVGMSQKARAMIANGQDVLLLSQGEPDFETPDFIKQAAVEALAAGKTRYTNVDGISELKQAVVHKFKRDNNLSYTPEEISIAPGGKAILFNALMATLSPGDEVIIPAPCWVSYPEMVRLCGADPIIVKTSVETGFKLTAEQLGGAITSKTRWVILNSPSNPTGSVYTAAELSELAQVLSANPHVMILTDDIYEHLIFEGKAFATIAAVAPGLKDRTLTMNGVSKAYAMTGWRIGYAGGPEWLISAMRKFMGQSTSNPSTISQWAALAALSGDQGFLNQWRETYEIRRNLVCQGLNQSGLSNLKPDGAFYVFADCSKYIGTRTASGASLSSDQDFVEALLNEALVAVVAGSAFHMPGFFRLSFAESETVLKEALARIDKFCSGCR